MPSTTYYWDEVNDNIFMEEDENGEVIASYTHEPGLYGEIIAQTRGDEVRYYDFDGLGNTSELTDENENVTDTYEFSAFGEEVARTGTTVNPLGYKGALGYYTNKETGDVEARERFYLPTIGRWQTTDPLVFQDGSNLYLYVKNNPLRFIDPNGTTCGCGATSRDSIGYDSGSLNLLSFLSGTPLALLDSMGTCACTEACYTFDCAGGIENNGNQQGFPSDFEITLEGDCPPLTPDFASKLKSQVMNKNDVSVIAVSNAICSKLIKGTTKEAMATFLHLGRGPYGCEDGCECTDRKPVLRKYWWENEKTSALSFDFWWRSLDPPNPPEVFGFDPSKSIPPVEGNFSKCKAKLDGKIFMTATITLFKGKCTPKPKLLDPFEPKS